MNCDWPLQYLCCICPAELSSEYRSEYRSLFVMFVFRVSDVTIATDVICGFPTETAEVTVLCLL